MLHPFAREIQEHGVNGDESTNAEYRPHDGDFATYFRNKQVKLDTQAKEKNQLQSEIFKNCYLYITGYTEPSYQELKRLVVENGGQICAFLGGKSYCTHIIAASLTNRKEEMYANMRVVKPAWVTESVRRGSLLPWSRYRTLKVPNNSMFVAQPACKVGKRDAEDVEDVVEDALGDVADVAEAAEAAGGAHVEDVADVAEHEEIEQSITQANTELDESGIVNASTDEYDLDTPGPAGDAARIAWILEQRARVNCLDKHFLKDYFGKSRLHFLSTSKLELRNRCRSYPTRYPHSQRAHVLLHIDFDSFFVAVALKKRPNLANRPVCVSHGSDGSDVASCNYIARQSGVRNGQWVARAKSLCPDLVCLPYDFAEYTECSNALYNTLFKLLPDKISAISVDEAMIDVTHLAAVRPVIDICEFIRTKVREATGISVSVGAGANILMAKLALKLAKPDGAVALSNIEDVAHFGVQDLPGVGRHICAQLEQNLGITNVGGLSKVSLAQLQSTVGSAMGQRLYNYAQGIDSDNISDLDVPVRTVGLEVGWGVRVVNEVEMLEFIDMCGLELMDRLKRSGQISEILTVKILAKSPQASFVAPKFMGHGICEIQSRSAGLTYKRADDILSCVHSLVRKIGCPPLLFRGIGLHVKVSDPVSFDDPQQSRIQFGTTTTATTPTTATPTTPTRKPMISIPPRKKQRARKTLTQLFTTPEPSPERIDPAVLRELPTQIRKELLVEDYVALPPQAPKFHRIPFLGTCDEAELRSIVRDWIVSCASPSRADARAFHDFLCTAARENSAWVTTLELFDWFKLQVRARRPNSGGWRTLSEILDTRLQSDLDSMGKP